MGAQIIIEIHPGCIPAHRPEDRKSRSRPSGDETLHEIDLDRTIQDALIELTA
jgi:hypothetical protein